LDREHRNKLADALASLQLTLTKDDLARIAEAIPAEAVAGTRYNEHQMQMLDSEK
jgi:hypothetical protein